MYGIFPAAAISIRHQHCSVSYFIACAQADFLKGHLVAQPFRENEAAIIDDDEEQDEFVEQKRSLAA